MEVSQGPRRQDSRCPGGWRGQEGRRGPVAGSSAPGSWGRAPPSRGVGDRHAPVQSSPVSSLLWGSPFPLSLWAPLWQICLLPSLLPPPLRPDRRPRPLRMTSDLWKAPGSCFAGTGLLLPAEEGRKGSPHGGRWSDLALCPLGSRLGTVEGRCWTWEGPAGTPRTPGAETCQA